MDWSFKFDDEIREINCFNGLFNLFPFHFQNSYVFMKNNGPIATICMHYVQYAFEVTSAFNTQAWIQRPPVLRDHFSRVPCVVKPTN